MNVLNELFIDLISVLHRDFACGEEIAQSHSTKHARTQSTYTEKSACKREGERRERFPYLFPKYPCTQQLNRGSVRERDTQREKMATNKTDWEKELQQFKPKERSLTYALRSGKTHTLVPELPTRFCHCIEFAPPVSRALYCGYNF